MSPQCKEQEAYASAPVDIPARLTGLRPAATAAAYLAPLAVAAALACLVITFGIGPFETTVAKLALGGSMLLLGLVAGGLAGGAASLAERRAVTREYDQRLDDLDHDLRAPMTIIRGEVELVLSQENVPVAERGRSSAAIVEQLERLELRLRRRYRG
jgi:signal transduction histidine kinase